MKQVFVVALVVAMGWLAYYMHTYLGAHAWANQTYDGKWQLVSTGWKMLADALPLASLGVLVGAGVSIPLIAFCYKIADRQVHQYEIEQLKEAMAEQRQRIERDFEARKAAIEQLREQSYTRIHQADARIKLVEEREQALRQREDALDATLAVAYTERDQARQEARNTKFSYQRKVKHAEDLQARLDGIER